MNNDEIQKLNLGDLVVPKRKSPKRSKSNFYSGKIKKKKKEQIDFSNVEVIVKKLDPPKKDPPKKDSLKKDTPKKDTQKKDSLKKDSLKKDSLKKDSLKKDSLKKDPLSVRKKSKGKNRSKKKFTKKSSGSKKRSNKRKKSSFKCYPKEKNKMDDVMDKINKMDNETIKKELLKNGIEIKSDKHKLLRDMYVFSEMGGIRIIKE